MVHSNNNLYSVVSSNAFNVDVILVDFTRKVLIILNYIVAYRFYYSSKKKRSEEIANESF